MDLCVLLRQALAHERLASRVYTDLVARYESTDTTPDREVTKALVTIMAVDNQAHVQALSRLFGQYCPRESLTD